MTQQNKSHKLTFVAQMAQINGLDMEGQGYGDGKLALNS